MQKHFVLKLTWKGTLRQLFISLRSPPFLVFCLEVVKQFCSCESVQIQIAKALQYMLSNTTRHPPPPTQTLRPYGRQEPNRNQIGTEYELTVEQSRPLPMKPQVQKLEQTFHLVHVPSLFLRIFLYMPDKFSRGINAQGQTKSRPSHFISNCVRLEVDFLFFKVLMLRLQILIPSYFTCTPCK